MSLEGYMGDDGVDVDLEALSLTIGEIDASGALQETAAAAFPSSRSAFLRRAVGAAAGLAGVVGARKASAATGLTPNDTAILRFDLVMEYLQAGLYTEAERLGELPEKTLRWARVVGAHERAHIQALKNLLGSRVVPSPTFNYGNVTSDDDAFVKTTVAFEDLTAALLKWQAVRLDSREIVAAAVTLHSVETRHAAWIRHQVGLSPVTTAFDKPASQARMARLIASTRFITSRPTTTARKRRPRVTG